MARHVARQVARSRRQRSGWFGRGRTRALLSLGIVLSFGAIGTSAYWTDSQPFNGGSVASGSLHIDLGPTNFRVRPETYTWTTMTATGLYPGATAAATLRAVNNSDGGTRPLNLQYTIRGTVTVTGGSSPTDTGLEVSIRRNGTQNGNVCNNDGTLITAATPANRMVVGQTKTITSAPVTLNQSVADPYCIQVTMATNTPNNMQGATATIQLTWVAQGLDR